MTPGWATRTTDHRSIDAELRELEAQIQKLLVEVTG